MARKFDLAEILAPLDDIVRRLHARRTRLMSEVGVIDDNLTRFGAGAKRRGRPAASPNHQPKRKGKRVRRSREAVEAEAAEIVEFIKGAGKEGLGAKNIKSKFHVSAPSIKAYLKQYAPQAKIKTTGHKSTMRYFV